jgi:hypothetical protein
MDTQKLSKEELRSRLKGRLEISQMSRLPKIQKQEKFEKLQSEVKGVLEKMKSNSQN